MSQTKGAQNAKHCTYGFRNQTSFTRVAMINNNWSCTGTHVASGSPILVPEQEIILTAK